MDGVRIAGVTHRHGQGFSTGKWDGDILTVYTTHIKRSGFAATACPTARSRR